MKSERCPHCGNVVPKLIEDNGLGKRDLDYTLLCVARCKPEDSAYNDPPQEPGADGMVLCGMQWCPNA